MENNCLTALYLIMILTKVTLRPEYLEEFLNWKILQVTKKDPEKVEFSAMKEIFKLVQVIILFLNNPN